jgi:hypothetical protein
MADSLIPIATQDKEEPMNQAMIVLSQPLQALAERYLSARRRSGEALLEAAQALAAARDLARYGEWYRFLQVTQTSAATAERLLNIHRLATQNLQFAGFVRDNWIGVSVAGLLARPSTPPTVIERVTAGQIVPTIDAVQSAIDAVEEQAAAPPFDPVEHQAAAAAEFHALDDEIRDATAMVLRGITTTAPALATLHRRLTPEQFDALLRAEDMDRALAAVLISYATNPPQSLNDIPESVLTLLLPWAIRYHAAHQPPAE